MTVRLLVVRRRLVQLVRHLRGRTAAEVTEAEVTEAITTGEVHPVDPVAMVDRHLPAEQLLHGTNRNIIVDRPAADLPAVDHPAAMVATVVHQEDTVAMAATTALLSILHPIWELHPVSVVAHQDRLPVLVRRLAWVACTRVVMVGTAMLLHRLLRPAMRHRHLLQAVRRRRRHPATNLHRLHHRVLEQLQLEAD